MKNIEYLLKYNYSWNTEGVKEDIEFKLRKISNDMAKMYTTSCVIVVVKPCDKRGCYDKMDIHIFDTFLSANDILNNKMYEKYDNVEVYHYNCLSDKYTSVMYKCYDTGSYSRLACIKSEKMFDDNFWFKARKVFDMEETKVTLYPPELF